MFVPGLERIAWSPLRRVPGALAKWMRTPRGHSPGQGPRKQHSEGLSMAGFADVEAIPRTGSHAGVAWARPLRRIASTCEKSAVP